MNTLSWLPFDEMMRVDKALDRARKGMFVRSWWLYLLRLDYALSAEGFTS